jgi:glycosyltransferase involved in cell wall biosynthesis
MSAPRLKSCIVNLAELDPPRNGGQSRVAFEVSRLLADEFYVGRLDVHFVVGWRFAAEFEGWLGHTRLQVIPFFSEQDLSSALYSQMQPDLIISPLRGAWPFTSTNPYPGVFHIATMADALALDHPELFDAAGLAERRKRYAELQFATLVATNTADSRRRLMKQTGLPPDRVRVVPLAGELPMGTLPLLPPQVLPPYVFYPANGWPHKRHGLLFQAIKLIRRTRPDVRLVLTGWQNPGYIEALAKQHHCGPDDFVQLGYVADDAQMASLYRSAEALMFSSFYEGFGMPVLEAMQYDCPVICAPVTSLPEIAAEAALYVDSEDPAEWARAFLEELPGRRTELVRLGKHQAGKYTWVNARQKWTELLVEAGLNFAGEPREPARAAEPHYHAALRELHAWASRHAGSERQLQEKEEVIQGQARLLEEQRELISVLRTEEKLILSQQAELISKEQVIRSLIVYRHFSVLYWLWLPVHYLFKRFGIAAKIRRFYEQVFPLEKVFHQYPPKPLQIPDRYHNVSVFDHVSRPQVSIVTPSFNHAQFLERTMQSVLQQNYPNLEYIVQDGGSTDGTDKILEKYRTQLKSGESRPDRGQANAINLGFQHASGEIMAWLNSDDLLLPGTVSYVSRYFLEHPEVDVVYGHRINIDENDQEIGRWIMPTHDDELLRWADYIPQETLFWRRRIWDKVGASLDESFQFALDWDLLLRFQDAGANFARLPRFLGAFRVHAAQKTQAVMDGTGQEEMNRLRLRSHGRAVTWFELKRHTKSYLFRSTLLRRLHRLGLLNN